MSVNIPLLDLRKRWLDYRLESLKLDGNLTISDVDNIILNDQIGVGYAFWNGSVFSLDDSPSGGQTAFEGYSGVGTFSTTNNTEIMLKPDTSIINETTNYNPATGLYTCPVNGAYRTEFHVNQLNTADPSTTGANANIQIVFAGVLNSLPFYINKSNFGNSVSISGTTTRYYTAGTTIGVEYTGNPSGSQTVTFESGVFFVAEYTQ